ncbi:MAG: lysophospholipid acyltransferase family protein [Simkaniaceae bacterium]|nr:lysophospholipid acyltransferase family protein [Simkaniaceae bacterium]
MKKVICYLVKSLARILLRLFYGLKIYGVKHFVDGGAIIASNHVSFLDPPIVAASAPCSVHFLARDTLFRNPVFGGAIRVLNAHPISGKAGDVALFRIMTALLKEGKKVILFPEGTRSFDGELQEVRPGIGMLVAKSEAAIIPTYIAGAYKAWSRNRTIPRIFCRISCVFGSPIFWSDFDHLDRKEAKRAIVAKYDAAMHELKAWYESGAKGSPP